MTPLFRPDLIAVQTIGGKFEIVMLHGATGIRTLLLLGLIFSTRTFLAILLRNRRKTPAA